MDDSLWAVEARASDDLERLRRQYRDLVWAIEDGGLTHEAAAALEAALWRQWGAAYTRWQNVFRAACAAHIAQLGGRRAA
jgi:hypothetical protein